MGTVAATAVARADAVAAVVVPARRTTGRGGPGSSAPPLHLQALAGNRAAQRLLTASGRRSVRAATRSAPVIQRYADLFATFPISAELSDAVRQVWLPRFTAIQQTLSNKVTVDTQLTNLATYMLEHGVGVSEALADHEKGVWTGSRPILTDFVPAEVFRNVVRKGQMFEDLVGKSHGIQTHRIQWYIVGSVTTPEQAHALYQEALNPRWTANGRTMWDLTVDETGAQAQDFTQPDRLETYLVQAADLLEQANPVKQLGAQIKAMNERQPASKAVMHRRYPKARKFTAAMKTAIAQHRSLIEQAQASNSGLERTALRAQAMEVVKPIEGVLITNTTKVEGVKKTITWTGWIPLQGSQAQDAEVELPYLVPSVAYEKGSDPDEAK